MGNLTCIVRIKPLVDIKYKKKKKREMKCWKTKYMSKIYYLLFPMFTSNLQIQNKALERRFDVE